MNRRLSVEQPSCGGHGPIQTEAARSAQAALVETFLRHALASGAISVPELEERARSAGLLYHFHIRVTWLCRGTR
jgi:hypothetical protein